MASPQFQRLTVSNVAALVARLEQFCEAGPVSISDTERFLGSYRLTVVTSIIEADETLILRSGSMMFPLVVAPSATEAGPGGYSTDFLLNDLLLTGPRLELKYYHNGELDRSYIMLFTRPS